MCTSVPTHRRMKARHMTGLLEDLIACAQVKQLMERYVTQLELRLTMDSLAETAVLADRLHHDELHNALVIFAQQEETRCARHVCRSSCASCCGSQCFWHHA